jgi:hypothetical protein
MSGGGQANPNMPDDRCAAEMAAKYGDRFVPPHMLVQTAWLRPILP